MKKKRKLTQTEYQAYKKQHDYEDVVEAEESKIRNEKETYSHLKKKSKQQLLKKLEKLITIDDPDWIEDDLEIAEEEIIANRKIRNARTHKNRLHGLRKYSENL